VVVVDNTASLLCRVRYDRTLPWKMSALFSSVRSRCTNGINCRMSTNLILAKLGRNCTALVFI
jgi:hypothetical protein